MADVRGIRQMLESLRAERRVLEQRLSTLQQREETLHAWLAEEEPRQGILTTIEDAAHDGPTPFSKFLQSVLADGKPHSTTELSELADARGLIAAKKSAKRAVHFAMLALKNWDYVKRNSNGEWIKK